uniref:PDZ domain-containing protein n=1 Tax=Ascaris lumbricoides TaxID=6252 RepID=A0A9J2PFH1_ASCLU
MARIADTHKTSGQTSAERKCEQVASMPEEENAPKRHHVLQHAPKRFKTPSQKYLCFVLIEEGLGSFNVTLQEDSSIAGIGVGYAFNYMDEKNKTFTVSKVPLNEENQAVGYTLRQFYESQNDPKVFHVMYSDDPPEVGALPKKYVRMADFVRTKKRIQYGHTKGMSKLMPN